MAGAGIRAALGAAKGAIDVVDIAMTTMAFTMAVILVTFWHFDMILNTRVERGLENSHALLYTVLESTVNGEPIEDYVRGALIINKKEFGGVDLEEYLTGLGLKNTCWRLVNSTGGVIFGNCTGFERRAVAPFVNGTLEVWFK